jgi:MFS family permease
VTAPRAARGAVTGVFALNGVLFGAWASRIPAVRDRLALSDGELGLALGAVALGAMLAMPVAGALAARTGSRRATRGALVLACLATGVVALAPSLPVLCALTLFLGIAMGSLDVTMNLHGLTVERRYERPILAGFHAAFSLGGLAGGGIGAWAAAAEVDVRAQLAFVAALSAVAGIAWSRRFLPAAEDAVPRAEPILARPPRRLYVLGALAFACLLIEGASADWSALYLVSELGTSAAVGAVGFAAFSLAMAAGRLLGDALVARFGAVAVVRGGGALAGGGFGLALLAGHPAAGILGFACLGAGMASIVPIVFRAAGSVGGMTAGVALAAVSTTGYVGFLVGPPAIGGLSELIGLQTALALLVLLAVAITALAHGSRPERLAPAPGRRYERSGPAAARSAERAQALTALPAGAQSRAPRCTL